MTNFVQTIIQGLLLGGVYALAASGLTLVFGVMNVINVAHGAMLILAAYFTWALWRHTGIDPLLLIFVTTPIMFVLGWSIYQLAVRRVRSSSASMSVLLTFSIALIIQGLAGYFWQNVFRSVRPSYADASFRVGDVFIPKTSLFACLVAIGVLASLWLLLTRSCLGRSIRAAAQNPRASALIGVALAAVAALTCAVRRAPTGP